MNLFLQHHILLLPLLSLLGLFATSPVYAATTLKLSKHVTSSASGPIRQIQQRALERRRLAERAIHIPMHSHHKTQGKRSAKRRQDIGDEIVSVITSLAAPLTRSTPASVAAVKDTDDPEEAANVIISQVTRTRTRTVSATVPTPTDTAKAEGPAMGEVPDLNLDNTGGLAYTIDVNVGGVAIPVIVDTGSSAFWVPTSSCETCKQAAMTISPLIVPDGCESQNITYGIGSAEGCYAHGAVSIGPYKVPDVELMGVTAIDQALASSGSVLSGILGLAGETNSDGNPTLVKAMYDLGLIKAKTVGFYLSEDESIDSEITFGDVTTSEHADPNHKVTLQSVPNEMNLYEVTLDSLIVGSEAVSGAKTVIIDTGSSYIYIPEEDALAIYAHLPLPKTSAQGYLLPCAPENPPTITFTFGGKAFDLEYKYLIGADVGSQDGYCWAKIGSLKGMDTWVIGDAFLHTVYTSFDVGTKEVTLYKLL
ncbi:hypothetical protein I302_108339 [Kwoniella bestiolae CBS 10118]|uniref:Peptidase A1 domain-containing protein n=1 Tax=Kwoniella bestiolae CBS 10118 TaxID=1296100 RepID=A0A1B9FW07_9TREE|nr:hypothetical protein I302_07290 [Kwoniella bestiolae CBS 10118]OCF22940.1 hypothetical protein I302_07290 [Kwoniella bestiolae CBS 10118]